MLGRRGDACARHAINSSLSDYHRPPLPPRLMHTRPRHGIVWPIERGDGTWFFDYSSQDNDPSSARQNHDGWLLDCLEDGIPVEVMTKVKRGGCNVWGLAFVERHGNGVSLRPETAMDQTRPARGQAAQRIRISLRDQRRQQTGEPAGRAH